MIVEVDLHNHKATSKGVSRKVSVIIDVIKYISILSNRDKFVILIYS
jgi:hypothetical protein